MPSAPRTKSKATKIAYKILGVPANMRKQPKDAEQKKIDKALLYQETFRVR